MSEFVTVANVGDIPAGEGRAFEVNEQMVAVFHKGDNEYHAIDDMCPHMGASLASGFFDSSDCTVTCPWHAWRFDTTDGTWCDNRRLKVDVYEVRIEGDEIQVAPVIKEPAEEDANAGERAATDNVEPTPKPDPNLSHPAEDRNEK